MLQKLALIINTLRFVKPIQIRYQIWYRIKNRFLRLSWYTAYDAIPIHHLQAEQYGDLILSSNKYLGKNCFQFLNLEYDFNKKINWNFQEHGKLWNYNLQYFDYLHDDNISVQERVGLLENFSNELLFGSVSPEPYPVSLRVINTILFQSKYNVLNKTIHKALLRQIQYLENNLEYHLLANHLLENIFTLYIASFAIKNEKLFKKTNKLLKQQLAEQILPDGAHYECTPMYHSIILSKLLLCIEVAEKNNFFNTSIGDYKKFASAMLGWMNAYSFPDGSWALMNDAALGIAPSTRSLNTYASKLIIKATKKELNECGYRKLAGVNWEVIIDVGNIMPSYQPGHAHADVFNFCLWYKGKQVIIDSGISTYNSNIQRAYERSTQAHNTVTIGSVNQSEVWGAFRVGKRAKVEVLRSDNEVVKAVHNGYKKKFNILHERTFIASENELSISDSLIGFSSHISATSNLIISESVTEQRDNQNNNIYTLESGIKIFVKAPCKIFTTSVSHAYNRLIQVPQLQIQAVSNSTLKIGFA